MFNYECGTEVAYLLIYVDDILLATSSITLHARFISSLHQEFDMADFRALNYFLGVYVTRDSTRLFHSRKYAMELLKGALKVYCNPS